MNAKINYDLISRILKICRSKSLHLATVESCTGGMIITSLTDISGSSDVVECGYVTYSNIAKQNMVGVRSELLAQFGAVSRQVAQAMAEGALKKARVDVAVAVTGIAGPLGGCLEKPVGLVYLALAQKLKETVICTQEFGNIGRHEVRVATTNKALELILTAIA